MRTPAYLAVLLAASLAISASPAQARPHRHHRMTFDFAQMAAVNYWAKRDVTIPCHSTGIELNDEQFAEVVAFYGDDDIAVIYDIPDCTVLFPPETAHDRHVAPLSYCYAVQYALGYIAGAGEAAEHIRNVPWGCLHPFKFRQRWDREHRSR